MDSVSYASKNNQFSNIDYFSSAIFALFLVVIVIYFSFKLLKYFNKHVSTFNNSKNLKVIESIMLNQNTRLYLIEVTGKIYAILENQHSIVVLTEVESKNLIIDKNVSNEFNSLLLKNLKKIVNKDDEKK